MSAANNQLALWVDGDIRSIGDGALTPDPIEQPAEDCMLSTDDEGSGWSLEVATDPKHRPQSWGRPSSTVRRAWCRSPQEAHLLEPEKNRYRRLTVEEIALIQGFDPTWVELPHLTRWQKVAALGDAVPPPLARAVVSALIQVAQPKHRTAFEFCAGIGGLATGSSGSLEHVALVEKDETAGAILTFDKPWHPKKVIVGDVRQVDADRYAGAIGLLSGGPPCQPYSLAGESRGADDPRDLLAWSPEFIARLRPEAFVFENVPGLLTDQFAAYLGRIFSRLRGPNEKLHYGVAAALLNAADFGVPQLRRRVFIVGLRDRPTSDVHRIFDLVHANASHRDPRKPKRDRRPWVTLREALGRLPDPGSWRQWIANAER